MAGTISRRVAGRLASLVSLLPRSPLTDRRTSHTIDSAVFETKKRFRNHSGGPDADAMIQQIETPMEDARQTEALFKTTADRLVHLQYST